MVQGTANGQLGLRVSFYLYVSFPELVPGLLVLGQHTLDAVHPDINDFPLHFAYVVGIHLGRNDGGCNGKGGLFLFFELVGEVHLVLIGLEGGFSLPGHKRGGHRNPVTAIFCGGVYPLDEHRRLVGGLEILEVPGAVLIAVRDAGRVGEGQFALLQGFHGDLHQKAVGKVPQGHELIVNPGFPSNNQTGLVQGPAHVHRLGPVAHLPVLLPVYFQGKAEGDGSLDHSIAAGMIAIVILKHMVDGNIPHGKGFSPGQEAQLTVGQGVSIIGFGLIVRGCDGPPVLGGGVQAGKSHEKECYFSHIDKNSKYSRIIINFAV